jgi:hypothetical protein
MKISPPTADRAATDTPAGAGRHARGRVRAARRGGWLGCGGRSSAREQPRCNVSLLSWTYRHFPLFAPILPFFHSLHLYLCPSPHLICLDFFISLSLFEFGCPSLLLSFCLAMLRERQGCGGRPRARKQPRGHVSLSHRISSSDSQPPPQNRQLIVHND